MNVSKLAPMWSHSGAATHLVVAPGVAPIVQPGGVAPYRLQGTDFPYFYDMNVTTSTLYMPNSVSSRTDAA